MGSRLLFVLMFFVAASLPAEDAAGGNPVTTGDPQIEIDYLDLLVDPLTRDELEIEVIGWRDLVKAKVLQISLAEIANREKNKELAAAREARQAREEEQKTGEEAAAAGQESGNAAEPQPEETEPETAAEEPTEEEMEVARKEEEKQEVLEDLNLLREEKAALLERLRVVVEAYEEKGGDAEEYRQYGHAVSGIKVEVTDKNAVWTAIRGWFTSKEGGIKWGIRVLDFAAIMLVFWIVALVLGYLVGKLVERHRTMSMLLKRFIPRAVRRTILCIGVVVALSTMGIDVGTFLALIGGSAFILGFALQDTLGNFASGLMLLFYRPFDVGDVVEVAGILGKVSLVNTTIRTFDNKVILVPNKQVWGQVITNATASDQRRVDMVFGISYDDDIDLARDVLERIVAENEMVLDDPGPTIELHELADSSVNFICRPWTRTADYWTVYWAIHKAVKREFGKAGLHIPYPQRDVHFYRETVGDSEGAPRGNEGDLGQAGDKTRKSGEESLGMDTRRDDEDDEGEEGDAR